MSERKTILRLPPDIRKELESKLINEDYTSLAELSEWLEEEGHSVTISNINRYKLRLCDGIHITDWLDKRPPTDRMRLTALQQEQGIITTVLDRLAEREKSVRREIKKHMEPKNRYHHGR